MKKVKLDKKALTLSIVTLITVIIWIGLSVFWTVRKTTITEATQQQMAELNPKIDKELIESLKNNLSFSEDELNTVNTVIAIEE